MKPLTRENYMNEEEELKVVHNCVNCGDPIYEYDEYVEWANEPICLDCIRSFKRLAIPQE